MPKFKVGDIVECIDARSSRLKEGGLYIIHKIDGCFLDIINLASSNSKIYSGWNDNRFRLAIEDKKPEINYLDILKGY